jgi:hypothetical protein
LLLLIDSEKQSILLHLQSAVLSAAADHGVNTRDPDAAPASQLHIIGGSSAVHDKTSAAQSALKHLAKLMQDPKVRVSF